MTTTATLVITVDNSTPFINHQGSIMGKPLDCNLLLCSDDKNKALLIKGSQRQIL